MKKRILYFDALEALAIFLVVSVHNVWLNGNVPSSIAMSFPPMAVPIFFMVHGALLLNGTFSFQKHLKRILKVFLQLYAWMAIYLIIYLCKVSLEGVTPGQIIRYFVEGASIDGTTTGHLWFIWALLSIYFIYPILHMIKDNRKVMLYLLCILFIVFFVLGEINFFGDYFACKIFDSSFTVSRWVDRFSPFGMYGNCLFFFLAGYLLDQKLRFNYADTEKKERKKAVILGIVLLILGVLILLVERRLLFGTFAYNWKPLEGQYYKIGTVMMAFGVFTLFSQIRFNDSKCKLIVEISTHTIDIYYIHAILGRLAYDFLFSQNYAGVLQNSLRAVIILTLSYLIGKGIRRIPIIKKLL